MTIELLMIGCFVEKIHDLLLPDSCDCGNFEVYTQAKQPLIMESINMFTTGNIGQMYRTKL